MHAASGYDRQDKVSEWLFACSKTATVDPDTAFDGDSCPRHFQSLDMKLAAALDGAIRAGNNVPLKQRIDRLQKARQVAEKPSWGGRRILYEVLRHLGLSEEGESRRALTRLTALKWYGDSMDQLERWNHDALQACEAADRAGIKNVTIVEKLRECMEQSPSFHTVLEMWLGTDKRPGMASEWYYLMDVFGERLTSRRSRLAEAEADGKTVQGPKTAAGTAEGGRPPPSPQGPPVNWDSPAGKILSKYQHVCRNHVLHGRCKNPKCTRDHSDMSQKDLDSLWWAAKELFPHEFRDEPGDASAKDPKRIAAVPICKFLQSQTGCYYGSRCQWPHSHDPQEVARAQKVRAARSANQPSGRAAGGVHAQLWDPDHNPWATWTAAATEAAR